MPSEPSGATPAPTTQEALEALDLLEELVVLLGEPMDQEALATVRAALGSARPPVPPQEISPEMVDAAHRLLGPDLHRRQVTRALRAALRVRGEPTRSELPRFFVESATGDLFCPKCKMWAGCDDFCKMGEPDHDEACPAGRDDPESLPPATLADAQEAIDALWQRLRNVEDEATINRLDAENKQLRAGLGLGEPAREPTRRTVFFDGGKIEIDEDARGEGNSVRPITRLVIHGHRERTSSGGYSTDPITMEMVKPEAPPSEVSRMEPFPLVPIPPQEVERETKAFHEKFAKHEDKDGMEPYDWREHQTMQWAIIQGFIGPFTPEGWYTFKRHRALTWTDPDRPGWEAFRSWALEILNGPSAEPDPWPVYDAEVYQAERLRRASA